MPSSYDYASTSGYARARPDWISYGQAGATLIRQSDLDHIEQAVYDLKTAWLNVNDFLAVGDGTTDDSTAFQNAINACNTAGGGIVFVPPGTYKIAAVLDLKAGVTLQGAGPNVTKLKQGIWPNLTTAGFRGFIEASGTYTDADVAVLSVDAAPGDQTLTCTSTASLTAGSTYLLGADRAYGNAVASASHDELRYAGEMVFISSVDSGTVVTLKDFVQDSYGTANASSLKAITYRQGIGLRDLTIYNPVPTTTTAGLVAFTACQDVLVHNCVFDGSDEQGVNLDLCRDVRISSVTMRNFTDDAPNNRFGYGVNFVRATENCTVTGCTFSRMRHSVTTNGIDNKRGVPRNIVIAGCVAEHMTNAAYDTHVQGANILFSGCVANNISGYAGFQLRTMDSAVIGCKVSYANGGVILGLEPDGAIIKGNVLRNILRVSSSGGYGVQVTGARHVTIEDNLIENVSLHGVFVQNASDYCRVVGNKIWNPGCQGTASNGVNFDSTTARVGAHIHGNLIGALSATDDEGFSTGSISYAIQLGTLTTSSYVSGNRYFNAATGGVNDLAASNTLRANVPIDSNPYTLDAYSNVANQVLLNFNTDRPWSFYQRSSGATASLDLRPTTSAKDWTITNKDGEVFTRFHAGSSAGADNAVSFCEDRFYVNDDGSLSLGSSAGPKITTGAGSPETVVTAPIGSLYLRNNGAASTTLYVKESGTGNTGWIAK